MKKLFKFSVCFILLLTLALGSLGGCGEKVSLVGWKDQTITAVYGDVIRLETTAFDSQDNAYDVTATVKTKDGKEIFVNGNKFTALEKNGYVINYTANVNGETQRKKVTVNVVAGDPVITFGKGLDTVYNGWEADIPSATAYDFYDGDISANLTFGIFKKSAGGDVDMGYDASGKFTFIDAGEYYLRASVTNAAGNTKVLDKEFTVTDRNTLTDYLWKVDETNKDTLNRGDYISAEGWAVNGVTGDYTGNAMCFDTYGSLKPALMIAVGNRDFSQYTHVAFWVATDPFTEHNSKDTTSIILARENDTTPLFAKVLEPSKLTVTKANGNAGVWIRHQVKIEDFLAMAKGANSIQLLSTRFSGGASVRPKIYIGDVVLIPDLSLKDGVATDRDWAEI